MAVFCTVTRMSPTDYKALTLRERNAFADVLADMNKDR